MSCLSVVVGCVSVFAGFRKVCGGDLCHEARLTSGLQELAFSDYLEFVLLFFVYVCPSSFILCTSDHKIC